MICIAAPVFMCSVLYLCIEATALQLLNVSDATTHGPVRVKTLDAFLNVLFLGDTLLHAIDRPCTAASSAIEEPNNN